MSDFESIMCSPFAQQQYQSNECTECTQHEQPTQQCQPIYDVIYCSPFATTQAQEQGLENDYQQGPLIEDDFWGSVDSDTGSGLGDLLAELDSWNDKFNIAPRDYRRYPPMCSSSFVSRAPRPLSPVPETTLSNSGSSFSSVGEECVAVHDVQQYSNEGKVSTYDKSGSESHQHKDRRGCSCGIFSWIYIPFLYGLFTSRTGTAPSQDLSTPLQNQRDSGELHNTFASPSDGLTQNILQLPKLSLQRNFSTVITA
eukprot:TRINITY_DN1019_c1_g1_i1.p3 TRINITY_DN1019_c1_g1~~TRINITY_DN1019_c1_g1_i1.p3  ORF type:complete len:255 (-),score=-0.51 TRINITY_DN1019_c1_g1_i1:2767-3531(-)